jgi:hypothetical protein
VTDQQLKALVLLFWTLTWVGVVHLIVLTWGNWDATLPLAALQFGPAIYAGKAYDRLGDHDRSPRSPSFH